MTNEDYVSYDLAIRLKKAGFNLPCSHYYTKENTTDDYVWITTSAFTPEDWNSGRNKEPDFLKPLCSAPTLAQAQKWLREAKHVHVWVYSEFKQGDKPESVRWYFTSQPLYYIRVQTISKVHGANFPTYESALSAGIEAALDILTNKIKDL